MSQRTSEENDNFNIKGNNNLPLQTRLVFSFLVIALIPLILITTRDTLQTQQTLTNEVEISLTSGARQTANSLDVFINSTLNTIQSESQFTDFSAFLESPSSFTRQSHALDLLINLGKKDEDIISYALVNLQGIVELDTIKGNIQKNESSDEYFKKARISDIPIVTAVTYYDDKTPIIVFASSIFDDNGKRIGILRASYRSRVLQEVISSSVGQTADISVILLDQFYIRMADTKNPELILKSIVPLSVVDFSIAVSSRRFLNIPKEEQATDLPEFANAIKNAAESPFFTAAIHPDLTEVDTNAIALLQNEPWKVVYSRPTSNFVANVQKQIRINIILVLFTSVFIIIITNLIARSLTNPLIALVKVANSISEGDLTVRSEINSRDEIGELATAFNRMGEELNQAFSSLEGRVAERTADLNIARQQSENRSIELQSIGEISKVITSEQNLGILLPLISRLVSERFGFYHTGIFLLNESGQFAVLQAANSEGGNKMLNHGHKLEVGGSGIVGYVANIGTPRISLDVGMDPAFFNNPDLPNTRSEMALPLKLREKIIGVLDVQSEKPAAFTENDANTLSILADQIAIAIENARLYTLTQEALNEAQTLSRQNSQESWLTFSRNEETIGYQQSLKGGRRLTSPIETDEIRQVMNRGKVIISNQDESTQESSIVVPIKLRGQIIGTMNIKAPTHDRRWSSDEVILAESVSDRLSLALENARLLQDSQRLVIKEQTISDVIGKIGESFNLKNVLQIAVEELGRAMPGSDVTIKFEQNNEG